MGIIRIQMSYGSMHAATSNEVVQGKARIKTLGTDESNNDACMSVKSRLRQQEKNNFGIIGEK